MSDDRRSVSNLKTFFAFTVYNKTDVMFWTYTGILDAYVDATVIFLDIGDDQSTSSYPRVTTIDTVTSGDDFMTSGVL